VDSAPIVDGVVHVAGTEVAFLRKGGEESHRPRADAERILEDAKNRSSESYLELKFMLLMGCVLINLGVLFIVVSLRGGGN